MASDFLCKSEELMSLQLFFSNHCHVFPYISIGKTLPLLPDYACMKQWQRDQPVVNQKTP